MVDDTGIRQLSKNRFQVRVKRLEKRTGRVVNRKTMVQGTKADARRARDELRAEAASTTLTRPRTRLHVYAESWLAQRSANPDMKRSGIRKYGYGLTHILPVLGDIYLDAISPDDVRNYVSGRIATVGLKGGNTVLNELRLLRTMARDSVSEGYAPKFWCDRVKPPKVRVYTKERPNMLTGPQFTALLEHIPKQWLGLIMFIVTTGLRWGEASALHWEDVDLDAGEATIRWGNDRGNRITVKTKGSNRTVPVLPWVSDMWGLKRSRGPIFPTRDGRLHKGTPLKKVLDKAFEKLNAKATGKAVVPRTTTHGLRRTFNNLARRNTTALVLKSITGHSTDAMMEHYSIVGTDEKAVVSRAVGAMVGVPTVSPDVPGSESK